MITNSGSSLQMSQLPSFCAFSFLSLNLIDFSFPILFAEAV